MAELGKQVAFAKLQASAQLLHHTFFPIHTFLASRDTYWPYQWLTARILNKNLTLQHKALARIRYA